MNKKALEIATGTLIIAALILVFLLFVIPWANNEIPKIMNVLEDLLNRIGINFSLEEEEEDIEPSQIQEGYMLAFQGIYETFEAGIEDMKEEERCLLEYPQMPNLKKNAIAFKKDGKSLKMLFIDDQGKELGIKGFEPIKNLTPCFVAGKTKDGEVVAKNFYNHWWLGEGEVGEEEPEYIVGDMKMLNQEQSESKASAPDTLEVTGNSEIKKGELYQISYNPTFLYKVDENHICFMPEFHGHIPHLERDCRGEEQGLAYACFEEIRDKVDICGAGKPVPTPEDEQAQEEFGKFVVFANNVIVGHLETCKLVFNIDTSKLTDKYFIMVYPEKKEAKLFLREYEQIIDIATKTVAAAPIYNYDINDVDAVENIFDNYDQIEITYFAVASNKDVVPEGIEGGILENNAVLLQRNGRWLWTKHSTYLNQVNDCKQEVP